MKKNTLKKNSLNNRNFQKEDQNNSFQNYNPHQDYEDYQKENNEFGTTAAPNEIHYYPQENRRRYNSIFDL